MYLFNLFINFIYYYYPGQGTDPFFHQSKKSRGREGEGKARVGGSGEGKEVKVRCMFLCVSMRRRRKKACGGVQGRQASKG